MKSVARWVGFDMDECLGTLYPLYTYCEELMNLIKDDSDRNNFYIDMINILSNEIFLNKNHNLWIFRPQFDKVLDELIRGYQNRQITGCFILSNNGSSSLVTTAQLILNSAVAKKTNSQIVDLFKAAWSRFTPCRNGSIVKSTNVIQTCLKSAGLQPIQNPETNLLFFDDKAHPSLKRELKDNFIQVSPYFNYTPYQNVFKILNTLFEKYNFSHNFRQQLKSKAEDIENDDMQLVFTDTPGKKEEQYSLKNPSVKVTQQISEFMNPLVRFIATGSQNILSGRSAKFAKSTKKTLQKTLKTKSDTIVSKKVSPFNTSIRRKNRRDSLWSRY